MDDLTCSEVILYRLLIETFGNDNLAVNMSLTALFPNEGLSMSCDKITFAIFDDNHVTRFAMEIDEASKENIDLEILSKQQRISEYLDAQLIPYYRVCERDLLRHQQPEEFFLLLSEFFNIE